MNGVTTGVRISSLYLRTQTAITKMPHVLAVHTITLPPPCGTQFKKGTSPNLLPTQHHKHCLPSTQYSESQVSNFSSVPATPSKVSICPLKLVSTTTCSRFNTLVRKSRMRISFPEMLSDSLYRNSLVLQTSCHIDHTGEEACFGGPCLAWWLHMICGCEVGCMCC